MTLQEFINEQGISAEAHVADGHPTMRLPGGHYWRVFLRRCKPGGRASMSVPFAQGSAHTKPPTAEDVLDCLASDATFEGDFEEFRAEFGYDRDDNARKTFRAITTQNARLRRFLGDSAFETLRYDTERL